MAIQCEFISILQNDQQEDSQTKNQFNSLVAKLKKCKKVVVVAGAGISVNSGIPVITRCSLIIFLIRIFVLLVVYMIWSKKNTQNQ